MKNIFIVLKVGNSLLQLITRNLSDQKSLIVNLCIFDLNPIYANFKGWFYANCMQMKKGLKPLKA